ncbi:MAG TPA: TonB-dependent receptor [Methylomirabilota bacterium]|nr:TonB-dependent receptor [Methylomirabilota bacterium]
MRRALALCLVGAGLTMAALASAGQEPPPARTDEPILPTVTVVAPARLPGDPLPLSDVPASVQVISGDELRRTGAVTLQDALVRLPGVTLTDEQGNRAQPSVTFRGFQATPVTGVPQGISVFVDGVRVNEPGVEEVNFDLLPLRDVERVELIRGPSAIFGRNTLGGALNIITRRGREGFQVEPEVQFGSFGRQSYRLRASGGEGPLDYYVAGSYGQEDGWRDVSAVRLGTLFAKVGLTFGDTDATLSFQRAQNRIEQPGSLPLSELVRDRRQNFTGGDFFAPLMNLVTLNVRQSVTEHARLALNGFVRTLDAEQFNANLIGADTRAFQHTTSAGGTLQLDHESVVLGRKNRLTLGLEYVHHAVAETVLAEDADTSRLDSKVRDRQHAFALYAQNGLDVVRDLLASGDRLTVTTGVRWDWLRHEIGDENPPAPGQPSVAGTHTFSRITPRLGVNYNLTPAAGLYLAFAQGIRAPAFLELTCASPRTVCPGLQAGVAADPPLKTVQANHYEIGGRLALRDELRLELALFRTDLANDIFSISPTGTTGLFFQNVGTTRRQGVELSGEASLGRRWDLRGGYTYTEATFVDDVELATPRMTPGCTATPCTQRVRAGRSLPLVPRHRVNATVEHRPTSWLTLWVAGAFVGSQRLRGDEENVGRTLDPYVVLDAGARVRWQQLSGFVTIGNALDDAHETFGTFAANARRPGSPVEPFLTPAPPLRVDVGLAYRF